VKPVLQALILADRIYREEGTGKHVICGTFNQFAFQKGGNKPQKSEIGGEEKVLLHGGEQMGTPSAYVSLTDVKGELKCELRYVRLSDDQVYFNSEFSITCRDPLATIELVVPLPPLPHHPGVHAIELLCDNELVGLHRITVREIKGENVDDNES